MLKTIEDLCLICSSSRDAGTLPESSLFNCSEDDTRKIRIE